MSRIKQRDSAIEVALRRELWTRGIRFRKNVRIFGTPDLALRKYRLVVFVDSCFWHGCPRHCRRPKSNRRFWDAKIERNRRRDVKVTRHYRRQGWTVIRFWEHELVRDPKSCADSVCSAIAAARGDE